MIQASKSTVTEVLEFDNDFDAVFNLDKWGLRGVDSEAE
jgi:hypothetical protein